MENRYKIFAGVNDKVEWVDTVIARYEDAYYYAKSIAKDMYYELEGRETKSFEQLMNEYEYNPYDESDLYLTCVLYTDEINDKICFYVEEDNDEFEKTRRL